METTENSKRVSLASLAYIIIILAGVKIATPILVPFLLSLFLVIITKPFSDALHAKGLPGWLVFTIILVVILLFDLLLVVIISASVESFSSNMSFYNQKLADYRDQLADISSRLGIRNKGQLDTIFDPKKVMTFIAGTLSSFSDILSNGILILLTVIFIFIESHIFPDKVKAIARNKENIRYFNVINHQINQYMMIKTYVSLGTGVIIGLSLALIRLDFAVLWGLIAFLLNYIPNIGSLIAAIPPIILALVQFGVGGSLGVMAIFLAVNFLIGNYIEPKLMGKGLGLSVLVVFLSLIFWGWLLGPIGMFLSIPITLVFKIIMQINPNTRWIAILLGDANDLEPELDTD
jgi:predicted PurR-regulated permease PerM